MPIKSFFTATLLLIFCVSLSSCNKGSDSNPQNPTVNPENRNEEDGSDESPINSSPDAKAMLKLVGNYQLKFLGCNTDDGPVAPENLLPYTTETQMKIWAVSDKQNVTWSTADKKQKEIFKETFVVNQKNAQLESHWSTEGDVGFAIYFGCPTDRLEFDNCQSREFYKNEKSSIYTYTEYRVIGTKRTTIRCDYDVKAL
jgi:hypothetical protein